MLGDSNSTSTHWLAHPQSLAWIRQGRPGATEEWAWEELQRELLKAACGASEGVPIDKFRYPWVGGMVDLIVLLQNNHLTFANIWWQHVECNLDWLKRDWPAPAPLEEPAHSASTGAEAEESTAEPAAAGPEPAQGADEVRPEAPVLAVNAPAPTTTAMSPVALPAEAETASTPDTETTPAARPLLDLKKLIRAYLEKLRASFEFGPSQGEPTAIVSPVRYAQSLLRRIEQLARELKEIVSRAGTTSNVFELFTSWKSDNANRTADVAADIATLSQKPATEDKTQNTPIDCTVDAAAEIATLKRKLTAVESRIRENAKSTPTLDDLRERMAALLRDPPTLDAARTLRASVQVMHGRALESANAAPEWPQLVTAFIARELGFVGMAWSGGP
jgi:hypothetical protein